MKTVAVLGGTFDPVHLGHLHSALELKQRLRLDELRMMPCRLPPHRESPGCSGERRLAMLQLACRDTELLVDDREMGRPGPSYSVETLQQLRAELGDNVSLCWVMGSDAFRGLPTWYRWRELLDLAHIVVIARPGDTLPKTGGAADLLARHGADSLAVITCERCGHILPVALSPYPISASRVRALLKKGQPVDSLLPARVVDYITQHHLYR